MVSGTPGPIFDQVFREQLEQLFAWRRDVRRFRTEPVAPSTVERLVALSTLAPSVGYSQAARFVSVADPARRAAVVADYERCNSDAARVYPADKAALYASLKLAGLREAPVHLAVFTDTAGARGDGLGRQTMPQTLHDSTIVAIHTLWLAARAEGIGVGWVSIIDPLAITTVLDVPQAWDLVAYLCVGYPQEEHTDRELARAGWEVDEPAAACVTYR